jgi:hypothetical protein
MYKQYGTVSNPTPSPISVVAAPMYYYTPAPTTKPSSKPSSKPSKKPSQKPVTVAGGGLFGW